MKRNLLNQLILASIGAGDGDETVQLMTSYTAEDAIPEAYRSLYTEQNGAFALTGVVGLKTQDDINRLQGALDKERNDHRTVKTTLSKLGDRSIDDVLTLLDSIPALEAAAASGDPTKIEEAVNARLTQHTAPLQRQLDELTGERDGYKVKYETLQQEVTTGNILSQLKAAALEDKVLPEAIDDVAALMLPLYELNELGEAVVKADAQGVTPGVLPKVHLQDLKNKRAFYWPASQGAGGQGGGGGQGGENPWKDGQVNLTKQGQMIKDNRELARQMCKAAGKKPQF